MGGTVTVVRVATAIATIDMATLAMAMAYACGGDKQSFFIGLL
jgi:hypothetical protein